MTGADGVTDLTALPAALSGKSAAPEARLYAFGPLRLDGKNLRLRPLVERRAMLVERDPLVVEVERHRWTPAGELPHAVFKRLEYGA